MKTRRKGDDDTFRRAMEGVRPLDEGRRRAVRRSGGRAAAAEAPAFVVERQAACLYGRRAAASPALLDDLRAGRLEIGNRLDLHGMSEESARQRVFRFVRQSRASGLACVALVHGRGLRSPAGPVLKESVPMWLTQLPLAREVEAFGSSPREQGGDGVTLVLLAPRE